MPASDSHHNAKLPVKAWTYELTQLLTTMALILLVVVLGRGVKN